GEQDRDRDYQEDRLSEGEVLVADSFVEEVADTGIGEHSLGENGAADDEAEREREVSDVRQNRVARTVGEDDPAIRQPLRLGQGHVVLAEHRDHHVPHAEQPARNRGDDDRGGREYSMTDRTLDEWRIEPDGVPKRVSAGCREPLQREAKEQDREQREPE